MLRALLFAFGLETVPIRTDAERATVETEQATDQQEITEVIEATHERLSTLRQSASRLEEECAELEAERERRETLQQRITSLTNAIRSHRFPRAADRPFTRTVRPEALLLQRPTH